MTGAPISAPLRLELALLLALISGGTLVLLFPPFHLTWLAPFALAPVLYVCDRESSWKRRFLIGWAAGFVFWCGLCPWIEFVMDVHGGLGPWGGWGTFVLFGLYKGLHFAVFAALAGIVIKNGVWAVPLIAALWTGIERTHGFFGFAWLDLGNAGIDMPLLMRLPPTIGVYGLSFLFAMVSCALALAISRRALMSLAWFVLVPALLFLPQTPPSALPGEKALLVQPNIDTEARWTDTYLAATERQLLSLSQNHDASLIVWPEVPAPFYDSDAAFRAFASSVAKNSSMPFLFGAVAFNSQNAPLNSAVFMDANGREIDRYDKINLVPFGEFIPPPFGFFNRITKEVGDFASGNRVVVFPINGHRIGAFICYESVFPDLVRQFTRNGAEVLVNLSNDGYFGNSAAHDQHLEIVRMRAAENRRWILRATNDGITAAIDPRGQVTERLATFQQVAGLMSFSYLSAQTFYTVHGDWFAWGCLLIGLAFCAYIVIIQRSKQSSH